MVKTFLTILITVSSGIKVKSALDRCFSLMILYFYILNRIYKILSVNDVVERKSNHWSKDGGGIFGQVLSDRTDPTYNRSG